MGKNLTQQKRGKGSPTYKAPTFRARGDIRTMRKNRAVITDIVRSSFHSAPLLEVTYEDKTPGLTVAVEGSKVGDSFEIGADAKLKNGNALLLKDIPEGVAICNIEARPGDGGKFARSSGSVARIVSKSPTHVTIKFHSKKQKRFHPGCLATIGTAAGGGRKEKPFLKAGNKYKAMRAKNKYWPLVSGASMNAVDHPFGGKRSSRKGRPTIAPKNAPPGRKVGMLSPRSTGRAKGRKRR